jgi:translation initiation factor 2B subunit (eIF-2B alpha/beta/delta family)
MENQKTRKEILMDEITHLIRLIEESRRSKRSCMKLRERLVNLILELDSLGKEQEQQQSERQT